MPAYGTTLDLRRPDIRSQHLDNIYNVVSSPFTYAGYLKDSVLASFPVKAGIRYYQIFYCFLEILEVFDNTPTITIDLGTMPTDVAGVVTEVTAGYYLNTTSAAPTALGWKKPANAEGIIAANVRPQIITPVDASTPVIYAKVGGAGALTTGKAVLHLTMGVIR